MKCYVTIEFEAMKKTPFFLFLIAALIPVVVSAAAKPRFNDANRCWPYVCADGARFPSCTGQGYPINYFVDPCFGHQKQNQCGNGSCEQGEANYCPPCVYSIPRCYAPCRVGSCPRDC